MQANYPPLPSENEATSSTSPSNNGNSDSNAATNSASRYLPPPPPPPPFPSQSTSSSMPFHGPSPSDHSFQRGAHSSEPSPSLNEVLHRSLIASSFTANELNEQGGVPRAHCNGKSLDLNALREVANREKRLFDFETERKDTAPGGYEFPFQMSLSTHSQWPSHQQPQPSHSLDNHHTDMTPKSMSTQDSGVKLGQFPSNIGGMMNYASTGSNKDLDYLLAANAARALVNHFGGGGGSGHSVDERNNSPSMGFQPQASNQPVSTMEQRYAHQRQTSDNISPSRNAFGLPSIGGIASDAAPPNMSAPFSSSPLPFSQFRHHHPPPPPPQQHQQVPPPPPPSSQHLLPHNPFVGLDPVFADRMKDYSSSHHLMDPRYPSPGGMPRLPRSASPMDRDGRGGMMGGDSVMSDASPNSSSSGKFVSPHNQGSGQGGNGGNIVLYPWMNPKSCGELY